jgi:hypothetical protein
MIVGSSIWHSDINGVLFALFNPVFVLSQLINTKKENNVNKKRKEKMRT